MTTAIERVNLDGELEREGAGGKPTPDNLTKQQPACRLESVFQAKGTSRAEARRNMETRSSIISQRLIESDRHTVAAVAFYSWARSHVSSAGHSSPSSVNYVETISE